jgi:hypothetical protein
MTNKKSLDSKTVLYARSVQAITVEQAIEQARANACPVPLFDYTGKLKARVYPNGDIIL